MGKSLGDSDITIEGGTKYTYDGDDWDDFNGADDRPDDNPHDNDKDRDI
jgi:hypothetical protein